MAAKTHSYDELMSEALLKKPKLAREVLLYSVECGESIEQALAYTITRMGIEQFAQRAKTSVDEVATFIDSGSKDTELLGRYLSVFGCELTIRTKAKKRKAA